MNKTCTVQTTRQTSKFHLGDVHIPGSTFIAISYQIKKETAVELAHRNEMWLLKMYKDIFICSAEMTHMLSKSRAISLVAN